MQMKIRSGIVLSQVIFKRSLLLLVFLKEKFKAVLCFTIGLREELRLMRSRLRLFYQG